MLLQENPLHQNGDRWVQFSNKIALYNKAYDAKIIGKEPSERFNQAYIDDFNKNTGTPNNYLASNKSGKGMLLDLKRGHIHLGSAADGKIYSGEHTTLGSTKDGFYLSHDGLSIGTGFVVATDGVATATQNGGNLGGWRIKTDVNGEGGFVSKDGTGILLDNLYMLESQ